jgi:hypothetical protein
MLDQPDFVAGKFHTAYLDELLRSRAGEPFTLANDEQVDVAVIAAAIERVRRVQKDPAYSGVARDPAQPGVGRVLSDPPSNWKSRARSEGVRE